MLNASIDADHRKESVFHALALDDSAVEVARKANDILAHDLRSITFFSIRLQQQIGLDILQDRRCSWQLVAATPYPSKEARHPAQRRQED